MASASQLWGALAHVRRKTVETQTAERVTIGSYTTFPVPKEPKAREEHFELLAATAIDMLAAELSKGYSEGFLKLLHYYARGTSNGKVSVNRSRKAARPSGFGHPYARNKRTP